MKRAYRQASIAAFVILSFSLGAATSSLAGDLYTHNSWPSLAADRTAEKIGDSLTVLIQENSQASGSSQNTRESGAGVSGQSQGLKRSGQLNLSGDYNYSTNGQNGRTGQLVATISVVVDGVLPNGDLHVTGNQLININGEKTQIHLTGRVRRSDVSSNDTVVSTSLADATIIYGGPGLNGSDSKPGLFSRLFPWLKK